MIAGIICKRCGEAAPRRGAMQKFCEPCSAAAEAERKCNWASRNARPIDPAKTLKRNVARRAALKLVAAEVSKQEQETLTYERHEPELQWYSRVSMPFSFAASKNAIYMQGRGGHVFIRKQSNEWRDLLAAKIAEVISSVEVRQNKLWLDIFVQKASNKSDAVNVVDLVCDAVKVGVGLDDRWFCIRHLDWEIVRDTGKVFVGVGQEDVPDVQACSSCGRLRTFDAFGKKSNTRLGIGRECLECRRAVAKRLKAVA